MPCPLITGSIGRSNGQVPTSGFFSGQRKMWLTNPWPHGLPSLKLSPFTPNVRSSTSNSCGSWTSQSPSEQIHFWSCLSLGLLCTEHKVSQTALLHVGPAMSTLGFLPFVWRLGKETQFWAHWRPSIKICKLSEDTSLTNKQQRT
jgi:hypothetical protein